MRVIVVGAGPAGAALSGVLSRRGIEVVLVEREPDFERTFRGEALMPGGVEALAQMGLRSEFDALPQRGVEAMEMFVEGTRILRADGPEFSGANAARVVSQPALLRMLVGAAARSRSFAVHFGATVTGVHIDADQVRVRVRSAGGERTLTGDFIVGADGRASVVRAQARLPLESLGFPFEVAWFSAPLPASQREDPRFQAFTRGGRTVVMYPSWNAALRVGLNCRPGAQRPDKASLVGDLAGIAEPHAAFFRQEISAISEPVWLKVVFGRCPRWSANRVLLLGDAAHPMSPVRAQGINLALRDVIVAANHLVPAVLAGDLDAMNAAAQRIQREREPEVILSQRLQLAGARPPLPARLRPLRATILPVLRRTGVLRRKLVAAERPLRHGTCPVVLSV